MQIHNFCPIVLLTQLYNHVNCINKLISQITLYSFGMYPEAEYLNRKDTDNDFKMINIFKGIIDEVTHCSY